MRLALADVSLGRAWVGGGGCRREAELLLPLSTSPAVPADVFQYRLLCGGPLSGADHSCASPAHPRSLAASETKHCISYFESFLLLSLFHADFGLWACLESQVSIRFLVKMLEEEASLEPWSRCSPASLALESAWGCSLRDPLLQECGATKQTTALNTCLLRAVSLYRLRVLSRPRSADGAPEHLVLHCHLRVC